MSKLVFVVGLLAATPQQVISARGGLEVEEFEAANTSLTQQQHVFAQRSQCPEGVELPEDWPVMEVVRLLGSGAFGTVHLCKIIEKGSANWIPPVGTEVAVKTAERMGPRELSLAHWLADNGQEMDTGFPRIYGVGPMLIAMEALDGDLWSWAVDRVLENLGDEDDVEDHVQRGKHLTPDEGDMTRRAATPSPGRDWYEVIMPDEVKSMLAASCNNLKNVHETGILHRDIKPQNIGIKNGGRIVRFLDLGSACSSVIGGDAECEAAGEESCVGTRPFFAPELWWCSCRQDFAEQFWSCDGDMGAASMQTDIFAFGRAAVSFIQLAVWGDVDMRGWPPTAENVEGLLRDLDSWRGVNWRQLLSPTPGERQLPDDCQMFFANLDASERLPAVEEWNEDTEPEEGKHRRGFSPFLLEGIKIGVITVERAREIQKASDEKTKRILRDEELRALSKKEKRRLELEKKKEGTGGVFTLGKWTVGTKMEAHKAITEVIGEEEEEGDLVA